MSVEIRTSLRILSADQTPEQIANVVGASPDRAWYVGDVVPGTILIRRKNAWIIQSALAPNADIDRQVSEVLERVKEKTDGIRSVAERAEAFVSCAVEVRGDDRPALYFSASTVRQLAALGVGLDIDLYSFSDNGASSETQTSERDQE